MVGRVAVGLIHLFFILITSWLLRAQMVDESVLASGPPIPLPKNETTIGINPLDTNNVIVGAIDSRLGAARCGVYVSSDGGQNWSQRILPPLDESGTDSALTFDSFGNAYYACLHNTSRVDVHRSTDGGITWGVIGTVAVPGADKPAIASDPTRESIDADGNAVNVIYVTWTSLVGDTFIYFSQSGDGGATWSPRLRVNENSGRNQGSAIAVDNSGNVVVAWQNLEQPQILMTVVDPKAGTTSGEILVGNEDIRPVPFVLVVEGESQRYRVNSFPSITFDRTAGPDGGRLYVLWAGLRDGDGSVIYETSTGDLGASWQQPVVLNANAPGNYVQIFPWVSVAADGTVFASYYDSQGDARPVRRLRLWGSFLSGELVSAPAKFRISSPDTLWTDPLIGPPGFIGDYTGNTCSPTTPLVCYSAWMANASPNSQDIYVGRIRR